MKRSKLITMAISLLAAICLWAYVVTVVNPDGDTIISGIPVTFSGQEVLREDQQLVIKGDYTDMVSVHFYGKNTDLKKLEQYKDEISAVVDVSKVRSAKEYQLTYQLTLPNAVQAAPTFEELLAWLATAGFSEPVIRSERPLSPEEGSAPDRPVPTVPGDDATYRLLSLEGAR